MKTKVYAVTSGEYSDYRVHAIFSTDNKARKFIESVIKDDRLESYNDFKVEEYILDKVLDKYLIYSITIKESDGKETETRCYTDINLQLSTDIKINEVKKIEPVHKEYVWFRVYVLAINEAAAIKIGNEKIRKWQAENT